MIHRSFDFASLILFILLPTALLAALAARVRHAPVGSGRTLLLVLLALAGFSLLDFALLKALPRLGLSYGPIRLSLAALWIIRGGLLLAWLIVSSDMLRARGLLLLANGVLTLGLLYAFYYEPFDLRVTRLEFPAPTVQPGQPIRVVQLSDLHVERITRREREMLEQVRALQPDLIVLTGDYLNNSYLHDDIALRDLRWVLSELTEMRPPLGVYAVNGSVEKPPRLKDMLAGSGVIYLNNELRRLELNGSRLTLLGISDVNRPDDAEALRDVMGEVSADEFSLLLYHTPDLAEAAAHSGVDLYLAGHTHGGQITLPFYGAIVTFSAYGKRFESGLYHIDNTYLYVNRGLGLEGQLAPRARFLAPPEILVFDLLPPAP